MKFEYADPFLRVVSMCEESCRKFCTEMFGMGAEEIGLVEDAGPADPARYKPGARAYRVWPRGLRAL